MAGLSNIVSVSAGKTHSLAVSADVFVLAWGGNAHGELGRGHTSAYPSVRRVPSLPPIRLAQAGESTTSSPLPPALPSGNIYPKAMRAQSVAIQVTNMVLIGDWIDKNYLDVIDYPRPEQPLPRRPASFPGQLAGLARDGMILFSSRYASVFRPNLARA